MIPRECDNDACDYETGVVDGAAKAWWVHVPECAGPVTYDLPTEAECGTFLDYLLNGPR